MPSPVVARRPFPLWTRLLYSTLALTYLVRAVLERSGAAGVVTALWLAPFAAAVLRPATRADADGVWLPRWRRGHRLIRWEEIDAIARPTRFDMITTLILRDGRLVALPDLPAQRAAEIAGIGAKPMRPCRCQGRACHRPDHPLSRRTNAPSIAKWPPSTTTGNDSPPS